MAEAREDDADLERLRAVVRANPRSTTFVALAHALCDAGNDQEAEDVCRQGLAQHPRLTTGQVALGRALLGRGRLREAQESLIEAAKASPEHGDAFRWLGEVVLTRGDRERARAILEYAEELAPNDTVVSDLLNKAGGKPLPRAVRPRTDFEHTRVGDARALAQRMHEDPPAPVVQEQSGEDRSTPVVQLRDDDQPSQDKTQGKGKGKGKAADAGAASGRAMASPMRGLGATAAGLRSARRDRAAGAIDDGDDPEPQTIPFMGSTGGRMPSEAGITAAPGPGASGPIGLTAPGGSGSRRPSLAQSLPLHLQVLADRWPKVPRSLLITAPVGLLGGILILVFALRGSGPRRPMPPPPGPSTPSSAAPGSGPELWPAILDGGLERLQAARAQGKSLADGAGRDTQVLAELALVNALLASEHGQSTAAEVEELAAASDKAGPGAAPVQALRESARALVALAAGRLPDASAAAERAETLQLTAGTLPARLTRFATGRVKYLTGDVEGAAKDLTAAAQAGPPPGSRFAPAVLAAAALSLDGGQIPPATAALDELTAARKDLLPARLLLAEARRAAGVAPEDLQKDCREQGRDSLVMRAQCAVDAAAASRLAGDRAAALKSARVAAAGSRRQLLNVRAVAQGALMLANLGDVDGAADALRRIREESAPQFPPRALAELAVAVGRAEPPTDRPPPPGAVSPDGRLLAARMALGAGGPKGLASFLAELDRKLIDQDPDLALLATLADEGKLDGAPRQEATRRAEKGSSLAAYVLGRHELAAGNRRAAGRWLAEALKGQGDSCEAGRLLLTLDARDRPAAYRQVKAVARAVRGRNGGCQHVKSP